MPGTLRKKQKTKEPPGAARLFGRSKISMKFSMKNDKKDLQQVWTYLIFGTLLGTVAPFCIFFFQELSKWFFDGRAPKQASDLFTTGLVVAALCFLPAVIFSLIPGLASYFLRRKSWLIMILLSPVLGAAWAILTGFFGGVIFVIIGGIIGAAYALPFGLLCLPLFASVYEPLSRRAALKFWQIALLCVGMIALTVPLATLLLMLLFELKR